ncbi:unnamed protein product [Phaedon cochleariae]|uniref:Carbonic anhydrase n=1 Tax=Phaedon cochleariae TaxID=80249 RepID=A0A9N9SD24_PHACE|nr:unnamed protein product [Phaedon cochleariae]
MITRCTVIVLIATGYVSCNGWKYQDEENWSPLCKEGLHQSPIALDSESAKTKDYGSFNMTNYGRRFTVSIQNNGHSAEIRPDFDGKVPEINGGGLDQTYALDHLHFHWQSEHTIDGFRYPLELHIVHYAKKYSDFKSAKNYPGGVAVVAVLFDLSLDDDMDFQPLVDIIEIVKDQLNAPKAMGNFVIRDFVPRDRAGYFRYQGSLTTPDCNEGVVWTIFTSTIPISKKQVHIFELLRTEDNSMLYRNFRSLQPLNDREVFIRKNPGHRITAGANINKISLCSSVVYLLPSLLFFFRGYINSC